MADNRMNANFRINRDLWRQFGKSAALMDADRSALLREWIENFCEGTAQFIPEFDRMEISPIESTVSQVKKEAQKAQIAMFDNV